MFFGSGRTYIIDAVQADVWLPQFVFNVLLSFIMFLLWDEGTLLPLLKHCHNRNYWLGNKYNKWVPGFIFLLFYCVDVLFQCILL